MAWIEAHQQLRNHPKVRKAARLLGISEKEMLGSLLYLWWWALDHAEDGDLSGFDTADIEDALGWTGDGAIIQALLTCGQTGKPGLLERTEDGRLIIHDWWEYAGRLIERRHQDTERKRVARPRDGRPAKQDVRGISAGLPPDVRGESSVTVPYLNRTLPYQTTEEDDAPSACPPEIAIIRTAYDEAGIMLTKTHLDAHVAAIQRYGIAAWQAGFAAARAKGKHNVPNYVIRAAESAKLETDAPPAPGHTRQAERENPGLAAVRIVLEEERLEAERLAQEVSGNGNSA